MGREFWKEDSRLESIVSHARSELGSAERTLASMMDKASSSLHTVSNRTQLWSRILGWVSEQSIASQNETVYRAFMDLYIVSLLSRTRCTILQ